MSERILPQFPPHSGFYAALRTAVEAEIANIGRARDAVASYVKISVIVAWALACYALYLSLSGPWVLLVTVPLGLALAAIGFNIQHDGGHEALSRSRLINRIAAYSLDLVGGSSYVWRYKHNLYHHSYTNIGGVDADIALAPIGRLAPFQSRRWFHRYQHFYLWVLYGLLPAKWSFVDDFMDVLRGRIGSMPMPRPRKGDLALFALGKLVWFVATFVIPAYIHGIWMAIAFYVVTSALLGVVLSVVFQLAHVIEETAFVDSAEDEWAMHQIATTANFAPRSRILRWYLGGLNFQVEHHLFPRVSHVHYPRIAKVVQRVCEERGVSYLVHSTFFQALRSHYRHLKANGRYDAVPATT